jgi:hypothetical protein
MKKVLVTAAGPRLWPVLRLSLPTHRTFASAHGYELRVDRSVDDTAAIADPSRRKEARWRKVEIIKQALSCFDVVLWVDADAMFCRFDRDILEDLPPGYFQGLVLEECSARVNPNSGVWLLRADARSTLLLEDVTAIGQLDHSWADQAALCAALGWDIGDVHGHGARPVIRSPHLFGTAWLPTSWNSVSPFSTAGTRVRHFPGMSVEARVSAMKEVLRNLALGPAR